MKKHIIKAISAMLIFSVMLCLSSCGNNAANKSTLSCPDNLGDNDFLHNDDYELVWHDEFDGDKLDTSVWGYEIGYIRNNEPQYYTDSEKNVTVKDGALNLICLREDFTADDGVTSKYTSGSVNTKGKKNFKYGAIEMRAKLPSNYNPSSWPAFWMMGENGEWPESSETDIMESYGTDMTEYESNIHWSDETKEDKYNNSAKVLGDIIKYYNGSEALGLDWHTYGIDWDEKQMRFYFDDKTVGSFDITDEVMSEIHQNNYILLDLALTPSSIDRVDDSMFPLTYQIDYVRVYQKK